MMAFAVKLPTSNFKPNQNEKDYHSNRGHVYS